jgi:hypothetical protein
MWSAFASENSKNLFVMMELASANPNNEWSVNTDLIPIELACNKASWHSVENAWNIEIYNLKSSSVTCYNFKYNVFITVISKHLRLCWKPSKHACIFRFFLQAAKKHLQLVLENCDRRSGTEEFFWVMFHIVKIECPLICSNPVARNFSYAVSSRQDCGLMKNIL